MRRLRVCSAMRPLLGSPIRTTVRSSTRGDEAAAGLADTAAAEAAVRGATERALAASEGRMARRKLDCGEGDWDRERAVNCAANIPGILSGRWAGGLLPFFVQCSEEGGAWRRCSAATEQVKRLASTIEHAAHEGYSCESRPTLGRSRADMVKLEAQINQY